MNSKLLLCLALGLSGGPAMFVNAAQPRPKQPFQLLAFDSIHMIDRHIGWARNARALLLTNHWVLYDKDIWRTTDGGQSWKQVLCESPAETGNVSACFRDSRTAWVAATDETTNVTVFRTIDGGASWSRSQLRESNNSEYSSLSFSSADDGWLMIIPVHGMNSSPGDLWRTSDGGAHWRQVNSTTASTHGWIWEDAETPEFDKQHPYLICGGEVALRNHSTGWVLGSLASTAPAYLFITRDGGLNWQVQRPPMPHSLQAGRMEPRGLPQFFQPDSREGILAAEYYPDKEHPSGPSAAVIYRTHDGGLNWQPTTPVEFSRTWAFITARKGWMWAPEPHNTGSTAPVKGILYRTGDGGISWKPAGTGKTLEPYLTHGEDIVQLDFVDAECGWAVARDPRNLTQLLHTSDGGETWSAVQAQAQR